MKPTSQLPIDTVIPKLTTTLSEHRNVVLSALPGAGKTTRVPLGLLKEPWVNNQKIIMLEPRRLAARSAALYMASLLGEQTGQTVGYRTRMDTRIGPHTRLEIVTEGILTRLLQNDPSLQEYNLVIFDEFHERSLQGDLGLALCLQIQEILRDDLHILVMSATLDVDTVSSLLGHAPIINCEGKTFPVDTHYMPRSTNAPIESAIAHSIKQVVSNETGNLLVFLPGVREIRRVQQMLENANLGTHIIIAPLYGHLSQHEQVQAIRPPSAGLRKIVLATSIAETSLTIEGIRVVIDSGLMRVPRYDPQSGMTRLHTVKVCKDSANQRRGRAGRLEPGVCYRLWSEIEQQHLIQRTSPEIINADLSSLALDLAGWGITNPQKLAWLDLPPAGSFAQARDLLQWLGAVDANNRITAHGKKMATLPLHPRLGHMILRGKDLGMGKLAIEIAAILNERDFLKNSTMERNADIRLRVDLLHTTKKLRHAESIDRGIYNRIQKVVQQLHTRFLLSSVQNSHSEYNADTAGLLLAFAYPDRIAQRQSHLGSHYRLSNGKSAKFLDNDPLSTEEYIVIAELDGTKSHSRIFLAAPVRLEELEEHVPELFHETEFVTWEERKLAVQAKTQRLLGKLVIEDSPLPIPSSELVTGALLQGIRQQGIDCLPWTKELRNWQARVTYIRKIEGEDSDWPNVSDDYLLKTLENWLGPFLSGMSRLSEVKRMELNSPLHALMTWQQQQILEQLAPSHLIVPTGSKIALDYCSQDIPILAVRLQELFGQGETPTLGQRKRPVMLHLLSPARRPIQVTQDLASFWANSYQEVKKELKGRYPKHYWPDDPLQAQPTRRIKRSG